MKLITKTCLAVVVALFTLTACEKDEMVKPTVDYTEMDCKTHLFEASDASGIIWKLNGIKQDVSDNKYEFIAEIAGSYEITASITSAAGTEEILIAKSILVEEICFDSEEVIDGEIIGTDEFKVERIDWDCKTFIYESFMHDDVYWMIEGYDTKSMYGSEFKFVADKPGIYTVKGILENEDHPEGLFFYDTIEVKEDCFKEEEKHTCDDVEMHVLKQECDYFVIESNRPENVFYTINGDGMYHSMDAAGVIEFRPTKPGLYIIKGFYEDEFCPMGKEMVEEIYVDESCFKDYTDGTIHEEEKKEEEEETEETTYDCEGFSVDVEELSCDTYIFHSTKDEGVFWRVEGATYDYHGESRVFDFQAKEPGTYVITAIMETPRCPIGKEIHHTIEVKEDCFTTDFR